MPYDPTKPAQGSPNSSAEMREQLAALYDLIATQTARINNLEAALSNTAQNPGLTPLALGLSDPPSQAQLQAIYDQLNALLNQLTRV